MSAEHAVAPRRRWMLPVFAGLLAGAPVYPILALSLVNAFDQLDAQAFGVVLPEMSADLHFTLGDLIWISLPAGVIGIAATIAGGYFGDRVNRVRLSVAANAVFAVSNLFTGAVQNFGQLTGLRIVNSVVPNLNSPSHGPLIADLYPPAARGFAYALWSNLKPVGGVVGSVLAGYIAVTQNWRAAYLFLSIPVLAATLALLRIREPVRGRFDFDESSRAYATTVRVGPLQSFRVLLNVRSYIRVLAGFAIIGLGTTVLAASAFFYSSVFGVDALGRGAIIAITAVAQVVAGLVGGVYLQRARPRLWPLLTGVGLAVVSLSYVVMALAPNLAVAVAAGTVGSLVYGFTNIGLLLQLVATTPPHIRAMAFAISGVVGFVGTFWYPVVGGLSTTHGYRLGILASCLWYLLAGLIIADGARFIDRDIERSGLVLRAEASARQRRAAGEKVDLLEVVGLDVAYGNVQVLFGVNLRVADGEMVALLGTNGAGKSTVLRTISGLIRPSGGTVLYEGTDVTGMDAEALAARGMIHVPGGRGVFPGLSVGRHLRLATYLYARDTAHREESMARVLDIFPRLGERLDQAAGTLSGGEQQMLNLAQAMMMRPRLLLIDELSLGLAPKVVEELLQIVERIHQSGVTVLLVEQSVNIALELASRAYFLEKGEVRFEGRAEDLADREDLVRSVFLAGAR